MTQIPFKKNHISKLLKSFKSLHLGTAQRMKFYQAVNAQKLRI